MEKQRYIYILISQTATKFGYVLRTIGRIRYNHAAIALDPQLKEWYSFARKQHRTVLIGGDCKGIYRTVYLKETCTCTGNDLSDTGDRGTVYAGDEADHAYSTGSGI